ncbi:MAG: hypothetical protein AMJ84_00245 [Acidithiobacillales bacterium SM23_46]|nr:MAG: hypothetical protein AMJ84_00245 [Acidithiobacillales bacterium SM23_46]KPL29014.1 MAG: hypothetical protein AMJ72_00205 [Acidithiobacillales bacterium SM1_46]
MRDWISDRWARLKVWSRRQWQRFKAWIYSILVGLGLITGVALADNDVNLSWTNATQYEDGTAMPVEEIEETVLYKQSFPLDGTGMSDPRSYTELARVPPSVTTYLDANQPNGVHCYVATHIATNGEESQQSNESCKTIDVRLPGAPQGLSAN